MSLSWRVQNIVVIGRVYSKLEHSEFSSSFEFDRNMLSGTGASTVYDYLSSKSLKNIKGITSRPICIIINQSFCSGMFPSKLKLTKYICYCWFSGMIIWVTYFGPINCLQMCMRSCIYYQMVVLLAYFLNWSLVSIATVPYNTAWWEWHDYILLPLRYFRDKPISKYIIHSAMFKLFGKSLFWWMMRFYLVTTATDK